MLEITSNTNTTIQSVKQSMFFDDITDRIEQIKRMADEDVLVLSRREPSAFAVLTDRYSAAFLRKAMKYVGSKENAEDVVQETFTKIYMYSEKFTVQEGASFKSWGYKILVNTSLTKYQKLKREKNTFFYIDPELEHLLKDNHNEFEEYTIREYIVSTLSKLPTSFAEVLHKYFIEGVPQKEIAEEEGVSVSAIKTRIHRAKKEFKKNIK